MRLSVGICPPYISGVAIRLQQLSVSQLENLLDAALDFTQVADVKSWLNQN